MDVARKKDIMSSVDITRTFSAIPSSDALIWNERLRTSSILIIIRRKNDSAHMYVQRAPSRLDTLSLTCSCETVRNKTFHKDDTNSSCIIEFLVDDREDRKRRKKARIEREKLG